MNMVEGFFGDLTVDCVREGSFASVKELVASIEAYLAERNLALQPYRSRPTGLQSFAKSNGHGLRSKPHPGRSKINSFL